MNITRKALAHVIEETSWAYSAVMHHESVNSDYADFAGMALEEFKTALRDPDLTREELGKLLRKGTLKHQKTAPDSCWTTFMSRYVAKKASNTPQA